MRKYNKKMGIILSGVVIVTNTQITTLSYALKDDKKQTTLEKNIEENVLQTSNYVKQEIVEVTNGEELVSALENSSIKTIDIKNDIVLDTKRYITIEGNEKEIKGNGYTVSWNGELKWITVDTDTKIDNLKLNRIRISCNKDKRLDIVNNSEIENTMIESFGHIYLENIKTNNTELSSGGNLVVNLSEIKDSNIRNTGDKNRILKIINTKITGNRYDYAPIYSYSGSMELENVKITNPGTYAIYAENGIYGSKETGHEIRVKGILEIDGAKRESILLKKADGSNIENPIELYIDGDIKQKGDTYTVRAEKEGMHTKVYYDDSKIERVTDKWSNTYYNTKNREGNKPESTLYENKLVGDDRYQTAIKVSNEGWNKAWDVVIVNSNSIVDALSATPFAEFQNSPILLTEENKLNDETKKEISRLGARNIYVIGGESVVSNSVMDELKSMDLTVERISGNDRYETSLEVAKKLNQWSSNIQEIAVVNGETGLADAVSIAPVAAENRMAIVLSSPNEGTKIFDQYIKDNRVSKSYIIGSEVAISDEIANKLPNPERLGGIDRNETNAAILEKFYASEELNNIFVAKDGMKNPDNLIDALSVGVLAAKENSPVVIVGNDLNDKQEKLLSKKQPMAITQVGGNGNENSFNKLVNIFKK